MFRTARKNDIFCCCHGTLIFDVFLIVQADFPLLNSVTRRMCCESDHCLCIELCHDHMKTPIQTSSPVLTQPSSILGTSFDYWKLVVRFVVIHIHITQNCSKNRTSKLTLAFGITTSPSTSHTKNCIQLVRAQ